MPPKAPESANKTPLYSGPILLGLGVDAAKKKKNVCRNPPLEVNRGLGKGGGEGEVSLYLCVTSSERLHFDCYDALAKATGGPACICYSLFRGTKHSLEQSPDTLF